MAALKLSRWLGIGLLSVLTPSPGWTLELNGQSYFTQPPWRVEFSNYDWLVDYGGPEYYFCLLYTSPSPRDVEESRMPSSA